MESTGSKVTSTAAIKLAITIDRAEEMTLKESYKSRGIKTCAVDFGGEFVGSITKIIERAVVASRREGLIGESHPEEGAVAGATHEALTQMMQKAIGLNIGGKIAVARQEDHVSVAIYFAVGLLNLNDVAIGLGHRVV